MAISQKRRSHTTAARKRHVGLQSQQLASRDRVVTAYGRIGEWWLMHVVCHATGANASIVLSRAEAEKLGKHLIDPPA